MVLQTLCGVMRGMVVQFITTRSDAELQCIAMWWNAVRYNARGCDLLLMGNAATRTRTATRENELISGVEDGPSTSVS